MRRKSSEIARKDHSNMASIPRSSSRFGPEKGEWERCSVSHGQLEKLQTQGFLPPTDLVPVRAGLTSFNGGAQAEISPIHPGGMSVLRSLLSKRRRISNPSVPPRASGVLWPSTAQLHSCLHPAHCGLRRSLRAIPGLRGTF